MAVMKAQMHDGTGEINPVIRSAEIALKVKSAQDRVEGRGLMSFQSYRLPRLSPSTPLAYLLLSAMSVPLFGLHHVQDPDHAARLKIRDSMRKAQYTPRTWRTHPLHLLPPDDGTLVGAEPALNWIFLVSALNFSFWSELSDAERYAVEWRAGWVSSERMRWTGYWSLVAAIDRGRSFCMHSALLREAERNQLWMRVYQSLIPHFMPHLNFARTNLCDISFGLR